MSRVTRTHDPGRKQSAALSATGKGSRVGATRSRHFFGDVRPPTTSGSVQTALSRSPSPMSARGGSTATRRTPGFLQRSIDDVKGAAAGASKSAASKTRRMAAATRKVEQTAPRPPLKHILERMLVPPRIHGPRQTVLAPDGSLVESPDLYVVGSVATEQEKATETAARLLGNVDLVLVLAVALLVALGTIMVYSASMYTAILNYTNVNYYLVRQILWVSVGLAAMVVATRINYHRWSDISWAAVAISILLLLLVRVSSFGYSVAGAQRWLLIPHLPEIQPSEVAKLGLMIYVAHWLAATEMRVRKSVLGLIPLMIVCGLILYLIAKQPDLGTSIIIGVSLLTTYFIAGAPLRHLVFIILGLVGGAYYVLKDLVFKDPNSYWANRLTNFEHPFADPLRHGFQIIQSLYALGSGGLTGVGLGQSIEKMLIPAPQTDSIFAILGEELGLVGTFSVLALFLLFAYRGLRVSMHAPDNFGRYLAAGITCSIFFQAMINMGVVTHLIPDTGVPLPFISFGGSSLAISMFGTGILLNISKHAVKVVAQRNEPADPDQRRRHRRPRISSTGSRPIPLPSVRKKANSG